jgi:hypothetical protein
MRESGLPQSSAAKKHVAFEGGEEKDVSYGKGRHRSLLIIS